MSQIPSETGSKTPRLRALWDTVTDGDRLPPMEDWKDEQTAEVIHPGRVSDKRKQSASYPQNNDSRGAMIPVDPQLLGEAPLPVTVVPKPGPAAARPTITPRHQASDILGKLAKKRQDSRPRQRPAHLDAAVDAILHGPIYGMSTPLAGVEDTRRRRFPSPSPTLEQRERDMDRRILEWRDAYLARNNITLAPPRTVGEGSAGAHTMKATDNTTSMMGGNSPAASEGRRHIISRIYHPDRDEQVVEKQVLNWESRDHIAAVTKRNISVHGAHSPDGGHTDGSVSRAIDGGQVARRQLIGWGKDRNITTPITPGIPDDSTKSVSRRQTVGYTNHSGKGEVAAHKRVLAVESGHHKLSDDGVQSPGGCHTSDPTNRPNKGKQVTTTTNRKLSKDDIEPNSSGHTYKPVEQSGRGQEVALRQASSGNHTTTVTKRKLSNDSPKLTLAGKRTRQLIGRNHTSNAVLPAPIPEAIMADQDPEGVEVEILEPSNIVGNGKRNPTPDFSPLYIAPHLLQYTQPLTPELEALYYEEFDHGPFQSAGPTEEELKHLTEVQQAQNELDELTRKYQKWQEEAEAMDESIKKSITQFSEHDTAPAVTRMVKRSPFLSTLASVNLKILDELQRGIPEVSLNPPVDNSPVEDSPVEDSPVEDSLVGDSPPENSSTGHSRASSESGASEDFLFDPLEDEDEDGEYWVDLCTPGSGGKF